MKRVAIGAVVLGLALGVAQVASASSGEITRAEATPDWTRGSFAGNINWTECTPSICKWLAVMTVQPSTPVYACQPGDWAESDPNIRTVWSSGGQTVNGTVPFDMVSAPILPGVYGQRLCLIVVYNTLERNPVCVAQAPVFGGNPEDCPFEEWIRNRVMTSKLLTVPPPPVPAPAATLPAVTAPPSVTKPRKRRCPKGKRKVRRNGKLRCVRKHRKRHSHR